MTFGLYYTDHNRQGPSIREARKDKKHVVLTFDYAEGLTTSDGTALRTFEVADEFSIFHPAQARVDGTNILVSSPEVRNPTAVRYGWEPFSHGNLVNGYGLPASTFLIPLTE